MYEPVCGMDNVTYSNECFLRKAECSSRMVIQVGPMFSFQNCKRFDTSAPAYWVGSEVWSVLPARTKIAFLQSAMLSAPLSTNLSADQMVR